MRAAPHPPRPPRRRAALRLAALLGLLAVGRLLVHDAGPRVRALEPAPRAAGGPERAAEVLDASDPGPAARDPAELRAEQEAAPRVEAAERREPRQPAPVPAPGPLWLRVRALGPEGDALASARFTLSGELAPKPVRELPADPQGELALELEPAPAGSDGALALRIAVAAPGHVLLWRELVRGELRDRRELALEIRLPRGATLLALVRDARGFPVPGAAVRLDPASGVDRSRGLAQRRVLADGEGVARFDALLPGPWTVQVAEWREWALGRYQLVRVADEGETRCELVAQREAPERFASGVLRGRRGEPLSAEALADLGLCPLGQRSLRTQVHADGRFFVRLSPGRTESWELVRRGAGLGAPFALRAGWHELELRLP